MDNVKTIEDLNSLIVINNDRIEGYKTASEEAKETDLKMLFSELIQTSIEAKSELIAAVVNLGGTPDNETRTDGKLYRVWMDIKAAFTGNDRKNILDSCVYGEEVALEAYKDVMDNEYNVTNFSHQQMLNNHYSQLQLDHVKVKQLRDLTSVN